MINIADGWARNSVNTVIFRRNSLVTVKDTQFVAFYDGSGRVVVGKRRKDAQKWALQVTPYSGHVEDAHKSISLSADGDGYLHLSWDHHNNPLNYCRSVLPGSLQMGPKMAMTGQHEDRLTYPEFYALPGGDLLFLYRDGASGNGNLVIDRYDHRRRVWKQVQSDLIDGEGKRNAYWQAFVDGRGVLHISWVWRESPDVASNHDICYARSADGGVSWEKSDGTRYALPITAGSAEYAWRIPQQHELINQTSMSADASGLPMIASYWRGEGDSVPQYQLIWLEGRQWRQETISQRKQPFSLSGGGTKKIPISRPLILVDGEGVRRRILVVVRDEERGARVSVIRGGFGRWESLDLTGFSVGAWEPTYDPVRWRLDGVLDLFVQPVAQGDGEGLTEMRPSPVSVLEWRP